MHHVGIFVVQVEQVDLVRQRAAIEAAFLHQHDVIAVRIGIDRARPHAARRALAADDQRLDAELGEMRGERRAVERAGALLGDDHVARLRLELRPDDEVGRDRPTTSSRLVALTNSGGFRCACRRSNRRSAGPRRAPRRTGAWSARSPHRRSDRRRWGRSWRASPGASGRRDRPAHKDRSPRAPAPVRRRSCAGNGNRCRECPRVTMSFQQWSSKSSLMC